MKRKHQATMPNGAAQSTVSNVRPFSPALSDVSKEIGETYKTVPSIWLWLGRTISWLWKWVQIYLHNIYVIAMPEKPRTSGAMIISIITLGTVLLGMYFTASDRDDRRVKELQAASEANGKRTATDTLRDETMTNQAKEIKDLKTAMGLLPPANKGDKK